jgi:hypothetical protein
MKPARTSALRWFAAVHLPQDSVEYLVVVGGELADGEPTGTG